MLHTALGQVADSALGHARAQTAAHLTGILHQHAQAAGWPSHVYTGLTVGWHDEEVPCLDESRRSTECHGP